MEDNEEEEDDDNYPMFPEYGGTTMGEAEEEASDEPADDLGRAIVDAQRNCESEKGEVEVGAHVRGSQKIVVPKLRRWQEKAGYHTGIAAMEGREWCI